MREALPNRRETQTFKFEFAGIRHHCSVSHYADGRPVEIFIDAGKVNTGVQNIMRDGAILISLLVDNSARLMTELNCSVAWIHHAGKDASRGARGSSVLRAAADTEILVEKTEAGRTATVTKQKDAESGLVLAFDLDQVELQDAEGETSCVVRLDGEWTTPDRPKALQRQPTGKKKHLLQIIRNALAEHGEASPGGGD